MNSITLKAPAKVNLFLDVLGKRPDGYHNILTLFEKINICDEIVISRRSSPGINISCDGGILKKDNLAYKAARLFFSKNKIKGGVNIRIKKKIPIAAGLGGGSSDAAVTLLGMNRLFKLNLKKEDLSELARLLGADVSFFIINSSFALGRDRGDKLEKLPFKPLRMWHLLIFPGVKKLTRDVYKALKLGLTTSAPSVKMLLHALKIGDFGLIKRTTYNRLEDPAFHRDPGLGALKSNLIELGMEGALLSGSGPTIFGITKTRKEAVLLKGKLLKSVIGANTEGWQMFIARTF